MGSTSDLPGGIVGVAVCAIILMAICVPLTSSLAGTLPDTSTGGENDVDLSDGLVLSKRVDMTLTGTTLDDIAVSVDGAPAVPVDDGFHIYTAIAGTEIRRTTGGLSLWVESPAQTRESSGIEFPARVVMSGGTVTFSSLASGEARSYSTGWLLYTHYDGLPEPSYGTTGLPAAVGPGQPLLFVNFQSGRLYDIGAFVDGEAGRTITNARAIVDSEPMEGVEGVLEVASVQIAGAGTWTYYAPAEWSDGKDSNALVRTIVSLTPVVLAAALVLLLSIWLFPDARPREDVFTSR